MSDDTVYQNKGYKNRRDYLMHIAAEYGIPYDTVRVCANILGPNEDFDGLLTMLDEWED